MVSQQFVVIMLIFLRGGVNFEVIEDDKSVEGASVGWSLKGKRGERRV